ncbi:MAG: tail sheath stabilizer and completion protein [Fischerella sp.]|nr:tail sheath stabilizer and completion protein [Fischerella sp.]
MQQFFYDRQIRRFVIQFIRGISNFYVEYGKDPNGNVNLLRVPVMYGDQQRQVASIINRGSENTLLNVPIMAVYIAGLEYDRARVQNPTHISKIHLRERRYNADLGGYDVGVQGDAYSIERLMPVPYKLTLKLDIWTSNTEQKLQIIEQMAGLFNPALELQSTDNYIDWTSLSSIFLNSTNWTSRTVPAGAEDSIDVATLTFELPIWISPPAKVKKLGIIHKIVNSIYTDTGDLDLDSFGAENLVGQRFITPLGYNVLFLNNTLRLIRTRSNVNIVSDDFVEPAGVIGEFDDWRPLIELYGTLRPGTTQIRLQYPDSDAEIIGTVAYHPTDRTTLLFTPFIDTIPANTLPPINAIIDPFKSNVNTQILNPPAGTRYMILNPIGSEFNETNNDPDAWRGNPVWWAANGVPLIANGGDIIEYNGQYWSVVFSITTTTTEYVTNLSTGIQYKWHNQEWSKSIEGEYPAGSWRIII